MTIVLLFPVIILVISYKTFKVIHVHRKYRVLYSWWYASLSFFFYLSHAQFTKPFTDVLIKDIKLSCRWWNGFDLIRRLLFIMVVFFFNYVQPSYTQVCIYISVTYRASWPCPVPMQAPDLLSAHKKDPTCALKTILIKEPGDQDTS